MNKSLIKRIFLTIIFTVSILCVSFAYDPPDPDPDPTGGGGTPVGGGAPIGGGVLILSAMALAYGTKKFLFQKQESKEGDGQ